MCLRHHSVINMVLKSRLLELHDSNDAWTVCGDESDERGVSAWVYWTCRENKGSEGQYITQPHRGVIALYKIAFVLLNHLEIDHVYMHIIFWLSSAFWLSQKNMCIISAIFSDIFLMEILEIFSLPFTTLHIYHGFNVRVYANIVIYVTAFVFTIATFIDLKLKWYEKCVLGNITRIHVKKTLIKNWASEKHDLSVLLLD